MILGTEITWHFGPTLRPASSPSVPQEGYRPTTITQKILVLEHGSTVASTVVARGAGQIASANVSSAAARATAACRDGGYRTAHGTRRQVFFRRAPSRGGTVTGILASCAVG
jgi:hypothetical protein